MKVRKTTFEEEQKAKDQRFLALTPFQRLELACTVRERMKKEGTDYSFEGKKVRLIRGKIGSLQ